jgi:6-phosphogluconolactonase
MELFRFDTQREMFIGDDEHQAIVFATTRFIHLAAKAIQDHQSFSVALSGGTTPKKFYEYLALPENSSRVNWSAVNIFWSDERAVPPDHAESNYAMTMKTWARSPIAKSNIVRLPAELPDLEKTAREYEVQIKKHCFQGRFDLLLLGVGQDGHTASLFPESEALQVHDRLVVPTITPDKNSKRLSFTFSCINEARQILVLLFGVSKSAICKEIFYGEDDYKRCPAQHIGKGSGPALFIVDKEAANFLVPHSSEAKKE